MSVPNKYLQKIEILLKFKFRIFHLIHADYLKKMIFAHNEQLFIIIILVQKDIYITNFCHEFSHIQFLQVFRSVFEVQ